MKTKSNSSIGKIKSAVDEFQTYSYPEFQKILPLYLKANKKLSFASLDKYFEEKTGISLRDYFHHVKADKANELLDHYKLSLVEAAYQLGFRTASSLKKAMGFRKIYSLTRTQYIGMHRRPDNIPKYV